MDTVPPKVANYLYGLYVKTRTPSYIQIDTQGNVVSWHDQLHCYGFSNLIAGESATKQIPFLEGLLPVERPELLEFMRISDEKSAHVHIVPTKECLWLLFIDASEEYEQQQKFQQQTYELSLLGYRYSQLVQEIELTQQVLTKKSYQFQQARILKNQLVTTLYEILHDSAIPEIASLDSPTRIQQIKVDEENALNDIQNEIHHLLVLVSKILEQNQIDMEELVLQPSICDIRALMVELESLFVSEIEEKGVLFSIAVHKNVPKYLLLDEVRFRQILINLLNNAFKFTPKGFIELSLSWQKNQLTFIVNDSGAGIGQERQNKIFTPHYRSKAMSDISGVGLIVSHHLVRLMQGKLQVKSLPQLGATFTGTIYAEPQDVKIADREKPRHDTAKILIVDESIDTRNLLRIYLEDSRYEVASASHSSEAESMSYHTSFDLILIAMQLTTKNGYEIVQELRERHFINPIIALLDPKKDDKEKAIQVGCDECISKPVWKETLLETVDRMLKST